MWAGLPPQALVALTRSHGVDARLLGSVNGSSFVIPMRLEPGGSVKIDRSSPVRRTLDCQVVAPLSSPTVDPYTAEVRAEYAVIDETTRQTWWVPVGTFVVTDAVDAGDDRIKLTGADRWQRIIDARFEQPVTTSGNTVDAIVQLLSDADGRIVVDTSEAPTGTHGASLWDRDRDKAVLQLARSVGADVFFDAEGVARIRRVAGLGDAVAWHIGMGAGGARISATRGTTRSRTYSAAVVDAEPQGAPPLHAVAYVATGKAQHGGSFGKRPRFYRTTLVQTQAQAQAMADGMRDRIAGVARTLSLDSLPNPTLDGGDVLAVEVDTEVWQRHMLQAMTLPLGLGTTPIDTRSDENDDEDDTGD